MIYVQPRAPRSVMMLLALTLVMSLAAAVDPNSAWYGHLALVPDMVLRGEVWRLVTWPWIEVGPWSLALTLVSIYWFGGDLADRWGDRRLARYLATVLLTAGVGTTLFAVVLPATGRLDHLGGVALADALVIAWALQFPTRQIRLYGLLAVGGELLAYGTLGFTALCAVYFGLGAMLPELLAGGLALLLMTDGAGRWARAARRRVRVDSRGDDDGPRWIN